MTGMNARHTTVFLTPLAPKMLDALHAHLHSIKNNGNTNLLQILIIYFSYSYKILHSGGLICFDCKIKFK